MDKKPIGQYVCPKCGESYIYDVEKLTITYPIALGSPLAAIHCDCGEIIYSQLKWDDAILFERVGAKILGFNFAKAEQITEDEIERFVTNMDKEIGDFLDACS